MVAARAPGSLRRISSLGALGEGSGWELRVHPEFWKSRNLEIQTTGNRHAQNVRTVLLSWQTKPLTLYATQYYFVNFVQGPQKI